MSVRMQDTIYGPISSDYKSQSLSGLCVCKNGIQTGPFGSQLHQEDYVIEGTPIITVEHLGENRIIHDSIPCVTDSDLGRLSKFKLRKGDIVFSRVGSVDRRALVRQEEDGWLFSGRCLRVRPDPRFIDSGYLSYFFGFPSFKEHIKAIAVGATMPSLNTQILSNILIFFPGLDEQRAIAHILGALDDKIELNRRMNQTLEAIAQAIFKSWFIDFDPVRAKIEGRDIDLPLHLADLFPDSFHASELGEIPECWRVGSLGELALNPHRGVKPNEIYPSTPYIALEHMPKSSIALTDWDVADGLESNKYEFKKDEILFGKLRPYFHKVGVAPLDGVCSTDIVVITPRTEKWFSFVLEHVSSAAFVEYTNAGSTGTKMPRTSWNEMARYALVIPSESIAHAFNKQIRPIVDHINSSIHESYTLASLRDTLLSKLITGQLSFLNIEHLLETNL